MNRHGQLSFERVNFHFGQVLRLFIEVAKTFIVTEFRFENYSGAKTRNVAGRDVMVATKVWQRAREAVDVSRAFDVDEHRRLALDRQVINRREMKENRRLLPRTVKLR